MQKNKFWFYYCLLDQWMYLRENDITIIPFLQHCKVKSVAIYGVGRLAVHLYKELLNSDIQIKYCIDKNRCGTWNGLPVYSSEEVKYCEDVDWIIVTPVTECDDIAAILRAGTSALIVGIDEIVFEAGAYCEDKK